MWADEDAAARQLQALSSMCPGTLVLRGESLWHQKVPKPLQDLLPLVQPDRLVLVGATWCARVPAFLETLCLPARTTKVTLVIVDDFRMAHTLGWGRARWRGTGRKAMKARLQDDVRAIAMLYHTGWLRHGSSFRLEFVTFGRLVHRASVEAAIAGHAVEPRAVSYFERGVQRMLPRLLSRWKIPRRHQNLQFILAARYLANEWPTAFDNSEMEDWWNWAGDCPKTAPYDLDAQWAQAFS